MPVTALAVPQSDETVSRNVLMGVIRDVMRTIGVAENTTVIIDESIGSPPTPGGTVDKTASVKLAQDNQVRVGYKEFFAEEPVLNSAVYREEYPYLFSDPDIGFWIKPTYGMVTVEMDVKFIFRDKSSVSRFKRVLRLRGGLNALLGRHAVRYDYSLPNELISFISDAHTLRETLSPYNETLSTYINRCFMDGLISRENHAGKQQRLAINEQQEDILGFYGEEVFYNDTNSDSSEHSASFTYKFHYNQILGIVFKYPLLIHNTPIPTAYRSMWARPKRRSSTPERVLSHMGDYGTPGLYRYYQADGGARLDVEDEWFPDSILNKTLTVVIAPIQVDPNDPEALLNLNDFSIEQLPVDIKDYLIRYPVDSLYLYRTPYHLQVYRVNRIEEELTVTIGADGSLRSVLPMDLRNRHYIRISIMSDLSKLPSDHVIDLLNRPDDVLSIFNHLSDNVVRIDGNAPMVEGKINLRVVGNNKVTALSYHKAVKQLPTTNRDYAKLVETTPKFVSRSTVVTRRRR